VISTDDKSAAAPSQPAVPALAASLILIDYTSGSAPKILFGRRHPGLKFHPGKFVFPGGKVEAADASITHAGALDPIIRQRLMMEASAAGLAASPEALALTAIRETYEETGLLFGKAGHEAPSSDTASANWPVFAEAGITPDLGPFHYVARAITPPARPKRFDTHFFAADRQHISAFIDGMVHAEAELVELRWVTFEEAQQLDAIPITHFIVAELARRIEAGLRHDLPVPFFTMQDDRWIRAEL